MATPIRAAKALPLTALVLLAGCTMPWAGDDAGTQPTPGLDGSGSDLAADTGVDHGVEREDVAKGGDTVECQKKITPPDNVYPSYVSISCENQGPGHASMEMTDCLPSDWEGEHSFNAGSWYGAKGLAKWTVMDGDGNVVAEMDVDGYQNQAEQRLPAGTDFTLRVDFPDATEGKHEGQLWCFRSES